MKPSQVSQPWQEQRDGRRLCLFFGKPILRDFHEDLAELSGKGVAQANKRSLK